MNNALKNRVVLITGGGTGIGRATALRFAAEGAKIMVAGRRKEQLENTVELIKQSGGEADYFIADVSKWDDSKKMVEATVKKFGSLDTLVTCAGIVRRAEKIEETTEEQWDQQLNINLKGVYSTVHAGLPELIKSRHGVIISISSTAASFGIPGMATYSASKGGVSALIRSVALQYASDGIRANAISPGLINTEMAYIDRPEPHDKAISNIIEGYPIKRIGTPEDIANAALFLASDQSSWITGQDIFVDGGFSIK